MKERFEQLDSLRGLAATSVLLSHLTVLIPSLYLISKLQNTPIHIIWSGHESVILFFILSGFVLSLPFHNQKAPKYKDYVIKRICRIYIPYVASILLSLILMSLFSRIQMSEFTDVFKETWVDPISIGTIIDHLIFLGEFNSQNYNPVIWSLVHEMRISILFPFVMYFVVKLSWKKNILFALSCTIVYFSLWYFSLKVLNFNSTYFITIHYIGLFIIGALLAKHRQLLGDIYDKFSTLLKLSILLIGVMAYTYTWWFFPNFGRLHLTIINDWITAIGGSIFLIFSIKSTVSKKFLLLKPVHFVGKTSYSLYLFHMPLLLTLVNIFYGKIAMGYIAVITFVGSFLLAGITYYLIEKPSINLGKFLTRKKELRTNNVNMVNKEAF